MGTPDSRPTIRVVIADDSYLVREALGHVLAAAEGIDLVASCYDRRSLRTAIAAEQPDVVVTDIRMPPSDSDEGLQIAAARLQHRAIAVMPRTCESADAWLEQYAPARKIEPAPEDP